MGKIYLKLILTKLKNLFSIKNINITKSASILTAITLSYGLATTASSFIVQYIQDLNILEESKLTEIKYPNKLSTYHNFRELKKNIIDRNIFNKTGEYPEEEDNEKKEITRKFSLEGPCPISKLKQSLLGTIYSDNNKSLAIIKDLGDSYTDYYKTGDSLINNEQVKIAAIREDRVILNNNGHKECLLTKGSIKKEKKKISATTTSIDIELTNSWISEQIGPGYANILQSSPYGPTTDGSPGVSLFYVTQGSLFDKLGLRANDTIKKLNGKAVSILDELVLYKIFEESRKIKILFTRGSTSKIINLTIK
jgi:type II secretion system protein C